MRTNNELVKFGTMVRGDILNAMHPIVRDGKVIGYIWANELTTDIMTQFDTVARNLFLVMLLCFGLTILLLVMLSRRTVRNVDRIIQGVRAKRSDSGRRIVGEGGEGEAAKSVNAMAEDIDKATKKSQRAMAVLQSVLSNVDATVYVCDPSTKRLVYVNDYLRELLAGRTGHIQGGLCYEILQGTTEPCSFCTQKRLFNQDGDPDFTPIRGEIRNSVLHRDFLVTDRLVTWHDGRLLHMAVGTDVTERKALVLAEAANPGPAGFSGAYEPRTAHAHERSIGHDPSGPAVGPAAGSTGVS